MSKCSRFSDRESRQDFSADIDFALDAETLDDFRYAV